MTQTIDTNVIPAVTITELLAAAPILEQWRNSKGRIMPLHLQSAPGIGKTALVAEMARRRAALAEGPNGEPVVVGFTVVNASMVSPPDIPGFILFDSQEFAESERDDNGALLPDAIRRYHAKVARYTRPTVFNLTGAFVRASDPATGEPFPAGADAPTVFLDRDDTGGPIVIGSLVRGRPVDAGIMLLDEFMQAPTDIAKAFAPLIDEGRAGPHHLPLDWQVIAASNRQRDASGVGRALAFLTNRWMLAELQPDMSALLAHLTGRTHGRVHGGVHGRAHGRAQGGQDARANSHTNPPVNPHGEIMTPTVLPAIDRFGRIDRSRQPIHPAIEKWLDTNADTLFGGVPSDPGKPFLTPRSAEAASNLFDVMLRLDLGEDFRASDSSESNYSETFISRDDDSARFGLFSRFAAGAVGSDNAAQMLGTLELFGEVPTYAAIARDPKRAHVSEKADAQVVTGIVISRHMTPATADAAITYAKRLQPHVTRNTIVSAVRANPLLMGCPAVLAWAQANPDVMNRLMVVAARR
jgi:hypothetical protein